MSPLPPATTEDRVAAGRRAMASARFAQAREHFEAALAERESGTAWDGLSWAGWWLDDVDLTLHARERAYRAYLAEDDVDRAAGMAAWLGSDHLEFRGDDAIGSGWLMRAKRLLEGRDPCAAHGWLLLLEAELAMNDRADPFEAEALSLEAIALGRQLGIADLEAVGLARVGAAHVVRGQVEEGMRMLDEASALATHERFVLGFSPGWTLCILIAACDQVGDLPRAAQWCEVMRELTSRFKGRHMMGVCRSSFGGVLTTSGEWQRADEELSAAVDELQEVRPGKSPDGHVRLGELRRRQGRVDDARALFERSLPHDGAVLGLGRILLAEGDAASAADAAERVLRRLRPEAIVDRVPALELLARARCAAGDAEGAAAAGTELATTIEEVETSYLVGRARQITAELALAGGDAEGARRAFEDAIDRFTATQAIYDGANARIGLARALHGLGRADAAAREAGAAAATLQTLGAAPDLAEAQALLDAPPRPAAARDAELSARELEVLRLVAEGCSDADIAERLMLSPHTVHRHVANVRVKLRQPSRAAAVAYAAREGLL